MSLLILGSSIGTANSAQVVVDSSISTAYEAQPGWQKWVTAIECISATGDKIPLLIIFKGTNLLSTWLPYYYHQDGCFLPTRVDGQVIIMVWGELSILMQGHEVI